MNIQLFLIDNDNVTVTSSSVRIGPSIFEVLDLDDKHVAVDMDSPIGHMS